MKMRRVISVVAVLTTPAVVAVAVATRTGASESGQLSRLSNAGRPVHVRYDPLVQQVGVQHASLLAVRGQRALYRLQTTRGICIGSGPATDVPEIGAVDCPDGPFPTAERPVLDLSVYESTNHGRREVFLYRAEGVVADGVASVAFLRPNGKVALKVPVSRNVFESSTRLEGPVAGIVAFDPTGKELWRSP